MSKPRILVSIRQRTAVGLYRQRNPIKVLQSLGYEVTWDWEHSHNPEWLESKVGKFDILLCDRMVGFDEKELWKMFDVRLVQDPANPYRTKVYILPQDVIDNTIKAFSVNATGYASGAPTGKYFSAGQQRAVHRDGTVERHGAGVRLRRLRRAQRHRRIRWE